MKHKICILFLAFWQWGCAVELRDRHQQEEDILPISELRVEKEFTLPVPLIQSEQVVLRYDRLVLSPQAELITQGLNVRIEVGELISEGGTIRTFKSDQRALSGENGRSGGNIELIVGRATGSLNLVMQGEKGAPGFPGKEPDESLRGAKGAQGLSAFFILQREFFICTQQAKNGDPGAQGLQGFQGGSGFKGGDSGTALIKIANIENFNLVTRKNPGQGGEGGEGGAGGPGGFGGDPGKETRPDYEGPDVHTYTVAGPQGPQGPSGPVGNSGINGYKEKICTQVADEDLHCE